jgi:hypothetical protein
VIGPELVDLLDLVAKAIVQHVAHMAELLPAVL